MPRSPRSGDWLSLLALTALWGSAFMLNEIALTAFAPAALVAGRIGIAALVLTAYMRATGTRLPPVGRQWLPMLVVAVFGNVLPFHLIAWAQQHIDSSLAGVLMAVMPLYVLTLAHFFLPGPQLTVGRAIGFGIGFLGVVIAIGPDFVQGFSGNLAVWGSLATLGAALSYAIGSVYARSLGATDPVRLSAGMLLVASALSVPSALIGAPLVATPGPAAIAAVLVLGLLATGFATLLYFRLVQGPGPAFLSLVNYLVPGWAVLAGVVFLDEAVTPGVFGGLALILAGIAIGEFGPRSLRSIQARLRRRLATRSTPAVDAADRA